MLRRPAFSLRIGILLILVLGFLAPAITLSHAGADVGTSICRAPSDDGDTAPRTASGWFDHCAQCGALNQGSAPLPPVPEWPWHLDPAGLPTLMGEPTARPLAHWPSPPSRAPPQPH